MKTTTICILFIFLLCCSSCEELLEVPDISKENVQLLAPADSTIVVQDSIRFSWSEVYEATQYQVQIATPSFERATQVVVDTLIVVDSTYVGSNFIKLLGDSAYEWRVKAMNSDYETPYAKNSFSVNTATD